MQKIIPNLWFDGNAKEAAEFYSSVFPNTKIVGKSYYPTEGLLDFQKPLAGKELTVDFEIDGFRFIAINAGREFKPNPSISFMLNFDPSRDQKAREHLDELWEKLLEGGEALMPLDKYPYSERYGWVKDKYGFTWQLILTDPDGDERPFIIPSLLFTKENTNRAEEAIDYYTKAFKNAKVGLKAPYPEDTGPAKKGSLMFADLQLEGQWFAAMDSGVEADYSFNEAISLMINCEDQAEIDYYWEKLSKVPEAEQCGWCKDQFGVAWQVTPANMDKLMEKPGAFAKMLAMHKIEIDKF